MENNKNNFYTCRASISFEFVREFEFVVPKCLVEEMELKDFVKNEVNDWILTKCISVDDCVEPMQGVDESLITGIGGITVDTTSTDEEMETVECFGE
jgi:hypothetical protein